MPDSGAFFVISGAKYKINSENIAFYGNMSRNKRDTYEEHNRR